MKIDPLDGRLARPGVLYLMWCHAGKDNAEVEALAQEVDDAVNGRFGPLDFWVYTVVALGADYPTAIDQAKRGAAAGILCLDDPFLASAACMTELRYFHGLDRAIPLGFGPVAWDDPRLTPELRDFARRRRYPLGDDSYLDVLGRRNPGERARFAGEFAQAIEAWLRARGLR